VVFLRVRRGFSISNYTRVSSRESSRDRIIINAGANQQARHARELFSAPRGARPEFDSNLSIQPNPRAIPEILPPAGRLTQTTLQNVVPEITVKGVAR
jgi:hypothetical protein